MWIITILIFFALGAYFFARDSIDLSDSIMFGFLGGLSGVALGEMFWILITLMFLQSPTNIIGIQEIKTPIKIESNVKMVKVSGEDEDFSDGIQNGKVVYIIDKIKYDPEIKKYKIVEVTKKGSGLWFPIEEKTIEVTIPTK